MMQETGNEAVVGYLTSDGRVKCIQVYRTGAWIWPILQTYYSDLDTLERLISMGDCYYFARNIGQTRYPAGESPGPTECRFYQREQQRNHYNLSNECSIRDFFRRNASYKFLFADENWYTLSGDYLVVPLRTTTYLPRMIAEVMLTCREDVADRQQLTTHTLLEEGQADYGDSMASGLFS